MLLYSLLLVIIPRDSFNVHDEVAKRLEPYEGEPVVEEREVRCDCVEKALDERARREAKEVVLAHSDEIEQDVMQRVEKLQNSNADELSQLAAIAEMVDVLLGQETHSLTQNPSPRTIKRHRDWLSGQPDAVKPDRHCPECHGTGRKKITVEFRTTEHGWCIGGRHSKDWAQYLNAEPAALREFAVIELDPELREYTGNVIPVKLLLDECPIPTGIVTPDGGMHSLFIFKAQSENGMARWAEFCRETYAAHAECLGVVCDYRF